MPPLLLPDRTHGLVLFRQMTDEEHDIFGLEQKLAP